MAWLEKVTWVDGKMTPTSIDAKGHRAPTSLTKVRSHLPSIGNKAMHVSGLSLKQLELVDSSEYLTEFGFHDADTAGHEIYCFQHEGKRVLVPAAVLLSTLLVRLSSFGDRLLDAGSLDVIAQPRIKSGSVEISFHKVSRLTSDSNHPEVQRRFTWLTCFGSARRLWSSVYVKALDGIFGCTLPLATIDASVYGRRTAEAVFVTRINIKSLRPDEAPLPFASGSVPECFQFNEVKTKLSSASLSAYRSKNTYIPPAQADILRGPAGWRMTDSEWMHVVAMMKLQGIICKFRTREVLDMALEKHGSGKPWAETGPRVPTAITVYSDWKRNGKWDILKTALNELRSQQPNRKSAAPRAAHSTPRQQLTQGPCGWRMSDDEWLSASSALRAQGFGCRDASKGSLDVALEKEGSGRTWEQTAPGDGAPVSLHAVWVRTGKWEALVDVLTGLRTNAQS